CFDVYCFFSSRRRHTRFSRDWSSDVCSSDLALGMVAIFFYRNHLFPGRAPRVMDFRATDDRFVIAIDAKENTDHNQIETLLKEAGAIDVLHNERKYVSYE